MEQTINLPENVAMEHYPSGDIIIIGTDMTSHLYKQVKADLPRDIRTRLIGWKRVARVE